MLWTVWLVAAILPTALWLLFLRVESETLFLDWGIYRQGFDLWRITGTPYVVLPPGWNPCQSFPYLYPPSSWPLLPLAAGLPAGVVWLGILPVLARPPRLWFVPLAAILLVIGLGPGLYLANVNVLVAGLLVLSFVPGRIGGIAFGIVVAIKLYPIALLPLLWGDRTRLRWFSGVFGALLVSGTALFGLRGWAEFVTTLLNEGPHCGASWNPIAGVGTAHYIVAGAIALLGLVMRSPTVTIVGVTWFSGVVTGHYLITFTAMLCVEPALSESLARLRSPQLHELLPPWRVVDRLRDRDRKRKAP
jgi:hypothetical protein